MSYETIDLEMRGAVAWLTLNRPKAFNSINLTMAKELCDLSIHLGEDKAVRAVVITGSGEAAYCAGGDVPSFAENLEGLPAMLKELTTYLHMGISRLAWMRAPVIAAVNGVAAGAGMSLAAACDMRIGCEKSRFKSVFIERNLSPDSG
ncbi:MAG: enoyl-CoA hydratase/isomerase family protein, partial [Rhodospirillaceae bacterium]|nr:enoyl-CoA hydratase/isomerase family protein [Rhodospirillaceae bacterium]